MTAPLHIDLRCLDADAQVFTGRLTSSTRLISDGQAVYIGNETNPHRDRWWRREGGKWHPEANPASWAVPHGTNPQMIASEIEKADRL